MTEAHSRIEVMLDICSGVPNPTWTLSPQDVEELKAKLCNLPASEPPWIRLLGYRGVRITNLSQDTEIPECIQAYDSCLILNNAGKASYREDVHHVEGWLLEHARRRGHGAIIDQYLKKPSEEDPWDEEFDLA